MQSVIALLAITSSAVAFVPSTGALRSSAARAVEGDVPPQEEAPPPQEAPKKVFSFATDAPGAGPFGFFDPLGLSADKSNARLKYFREAELKHSRVAMLAAAGFIVAEKFHPLFGGGVNVPSYVAYQETPLQTFWPVVVLYIGVIEVFSVFTFESPFDGDLWTLKDSRKPGDFDFDPLDFAPTDPKELFEMQSKELNNGRLAMIAIAGMVAQELVTGKALF